MRDLYIRNGHGFVIVFSLTSKQSFHDIKTIRQQILRVKNTDNVPIVIAANKIDAEDKEITHDELVSLANEWNVSFFETSAKNSKNINTLFTEIVRQMNVQPFKEVKKLSCCRKNCVIL
jgi:Ras-related protein Rap-2C